MIRTIPLLLLLALGAGVLRADEVLETSDHIYLFDHETVRYRLNIEDYGDNDGLHVEVYVRGIDAPPRARVLNSNYSEVKRREDTDGDWIIDFDFTAENPRPRYYIEVDSAHPRREGYFEIRIFVSAADAESAAVNLDFVKVFTDYEDGGRSDHYNCAASAGAGGLGVLAPLGLAIYAMRRRARNNRIG